MTQKTFLALYFFLSFFDFGPWISGPKPSSAPAHVQRVKIWEPDEQKLPEASEALVRPEDLELIKAGSTLKTPKILARPKTVPPSFTTSSSLIGANVGGPSTASESKTNKSLCCIKNKNMVHKLLRCAFENDVLSAC